MRRSSLLSATAMSQDLCLCASLYRAHALVCTPIIRKDWVRMLSLLDIAPIRRSLSIRTCSCTLRRRAEAHHYSVIVPAPMSSNLLSLTEAGSTDLKLVTCGGQSIVSWSSGQTVDGVVLLRGQTYTIAIRAQDTRNCRQLRATDSNSRTDIHRASSTMNRLAFDSVARHLSGSKQGSSH